MSTVQVSKKRRGFLWDSLKIDGIIRILDVTTEPRYYTQLFMASGIKYKKSFIRYLRYCMDKGFVRHYYKPMREKKKHARKSECFSMFHITDKGRMFLEMVS